MLAASITKLSSERDLAEVVKIRAAIEEIGGVEMDALLLK